MKTGLPAGGLGVCKEAPPPDINDANDGNDDERTAMTKTTMTTGQSWEKTKRNVKRTVFEEKGYLKNEKLKP